MIVLHGLACRAGGAVCRPGTTSVSKRTSMKLAVANASFWPGRAEEELKLAAANQSFKAGQQGKF